MTRVAALGDLAYPTVVAEITEPADFKLQRHLLRRPHPAHLVTVLKYLAREGHLLVFG